MKQTLSMKQYRMLDLFFLAVMMTVTESLILVAATRWFANQLYTVSVAAAFTAIVMLRWKGFYATIYAIASGFIMCFILKGSIDQYAVYCIGNLLSVVAVIPVRMLGTERIRENALLRIVFGMLVLILMQAGRALVALVLGYEGAVVIGFFTTDSLSLLFTAVIMWVAGRLDGILEDQQEYVERVNKEEEENRLI